MAFVPVREKFLSCLRRIGSLKVFILLAVTVWVAHFWHYKSFGLYEDDLYKITPVMGISGSDLWKLILGSGWEGRPLHDSLIYIISCVGMKLKGLSLVYWAGYILVTVNAFLFFHFLRRLSSDPVFAVTGALAFCLFPADTTRILLTHSLGIQPSLMFLLIAFLCYLSGKKRVAYLAILGSLFCYEPMCLVFVVAPLLNKNWDRKRIREFGLHALFLGSLMVFAFLIRRFVTGEGRCLHLTVLDGFHLSIGHMLKGPVVSLLMFLYRPVETLSTLSADRAGPLFFYLAGLVSVLFQRKGGTLVFEKKSGHSGPPESFHHLSKLAWIGGIMLVLAYPVTFTTTVADIAVGRESRVHAAAIVGASILCACLFSWIYSIARAHRRQGIAVLGLSMFFTLLVGFGLTVQRDYQTSWRSQRAFWTDVVELCPDLSDGTIILVESDSLEDPPQIKAHFVYVFPMILDFLYRFPSGWKDIPSVFALKHGWEEEMGSKAGFFHLNQVIAFPRAFPSRKIDRVIQSTSVILLEQRQGRLVRRTEPLVINGHEFRFKERSVPTLPLFSPKPLYHYLIQDPLEQFASDAMN